MRVAVIAITRNGALLGKKLRENVAGLELFVSSRYAELSSSEEIIFEPPELKGLIASLWNHMDGFVLIMASGIAVRVIAPLLESKATDPAVVVMDDAGRFAISLVSGHLGGANELAGQCAFAVSAQPVITTATDVNGLPSFDMVAKEQGWLIDNIDQVKILNTLLLDDQKIAVFDQTGQIRERMAECANVTYHETVQEAEASDAAALILVTCRSIPELSRPEKTLILRPRNLVLGIGCNRGTTADEIETFVLQQLRQLQLSPASVCGVASVAAKRGEKGLSEFAARLNVPLHCYENNELSTVRFPSPPSQHAMAAVGVAGVAEPSAMLAANGGKLLLKKVKSPNVTLAIAERNEEQSLS